MEGYELTGDFLFIIDDDGNGSEYTQQQTYYTFSTAGLTRTSALARLVENGILERKWKEIADGKTGSFRLEVRGRWVDPEAVTVRNVLITP
jgi:hypothetical protein